MPKLRSVELQMAEVQEWAYVVQVPPLSTLQMEPVVQFYN